jgi:predicted  nucleic acid-binding Zn-ribbon protein
MQEIHAAREEVVESLAMLPERRDVLYEEGETFQANLTELSNRVASLRKAIRSIKDNVEKLKEKRDGHESRLLVMETSGTYGELLPEIEGIEEDIRKTENLITQQTFTKDEVRKEAEAQEFNEPAFRRRMGEEHKALDEMERELYARHGELEARWTEESRALDKKTLDIFMRLLETCDGVAVARVKSACEACGASVPAQRMQEVREGEEMLLCENCGRILYCEETEPETSADRANGREAQKGTRAGHSPSS